MIGFYSSLFYINNKNGKFSIGAFGANFSKETQLEEAKEQYLKDQIVSALSNILIGLREIQKDERSFDGLLIVLDEIQNAEDFKMVAQLLRGITTTMDVNGFGNISFIVIGYSDTITSFFEEDPSAKRNFDSILLESMPIAESQDVLIKGFEEAEVRFDEEALKKNVKVAGGYPHSLQVLGHNLIDLDTDDLIDQADWKKAIDITAKELQTKDFSNFYKFKGKQTMRDELLNILALVGQPVPKSTLSKFFKKNFYSKSCLPVLKTLGAITEDSSNENLFLHSSLFRTAIFTHIVSNPNMFQGSWFDAANKILIELGKQEN